jgi:hypothetical protein
MPGRPSAIGRFIGAVFVAALCVAASAGCGDSGIARSGAGSGPLASTEFDCQVTFGLLDSVEVDALDYEVTVLENGAFIGSGADVECVNLASGGGSSAYSDGQTVELSRIAPQGLTGPIALDSCRFVSNVAPRASDFDVTTTGASRNISDLPIMPEIAVTQIDCASDGGSPSSTTTSTLPCEDSDCASADRYAVEFAVSADATVGAVQLEVHYPCHIGRIHAVDGQPACRVVSGINAFASFNDQPVDAVCEDDADLLVAIVSPTGVEAPRTLFACDFDALAATVRASDFSVTVVEASDPTLDPLPSVAVAVSDVRPSAH